MKERDAQIESQRSRIKSDNKWDEQLKLNIEKAFKEEQEKAEKRHRDRLALANDHLKQYVYINYLFLYLPFYLLMDIVCLLFLIIKVIHAHCGRFENYEKA